MHSRHEIGSREGLRREFKSADTLRAEHKDARRGLLRSIVAMRNARGGHILVGVSETDETLDSYQPFADEEVGLIRSLEDRIVDSIEPTPRLGDDVILHRVTDLPTGTGWILDIEVRPSENPTCLLRPQGARAFLRRSGARTIVMSYAELRDKFHPAPPPLDRDQAKSARERAASCFEDRLSRCAPTPRFGLVIQPEDDRLEAGEEELDLIRKALSRPSSSEARPHGWTWYSGERTQPRRHRRTIRSGDFDPTKLYRCLEVDPRSGLVFLNALEWLSGQPSPYASRVFPDAQVRQIDPRALVETVASTIRLWGHLAQELAWPGDLRVAVMAGFLDAGGWVFHVGAPNTLFLPSGRHDWIELQDRSTLDRPIVRTVEAIRDAPDALSYELLWELYSVDEAATSAHKIEPGVIPWFDESRIFRPPS